MLACSGSTMACLVWSLSSTSINSYSHMHDVACSFTDEAAKYVSFNDTTSASSSFPANLGIRCKRIICAHKEEEHFHAIIVLPLKPKFIVKIRRNNIFQQTHPLPW